ncbi:hypothetical protein [Altererythrobacter aquiaggeris]|uniref:hypothetical protein n=1 Tax=Aestuarierythrobacter aquiaggeris TaxID=1898396 RepID=UPI00301909B0
MDIILSILSLAALALLGGAAWLWKQGGHAKQVRLMLVLAIIMAINVAIWTLPAGSGTAPVDQIKETAAGEETTE